LLKKSTILAHSSTVQLRIQSMQTQRRTTVSAAILVAAIVTGVGGVGLTCENFSAVDVPPARAGIVIEVR
jgi:hypothetical protein